MNFLEQILMRRRSHVQAQRAACDANALHQQAVEVCQEKSPHRLRSALSENDGVNIIAEFKRASPSLGMINRHANVDEIVALYEIGNAAAISILTEHESFHGSIDDLSAARVATGLPILRKDFTVDEFQIDEAAANGADAILLIVAALTDEDLSRLRTHAEERLGLDALVEVHDAQEFGRAIACGASLIGVNNRDLGTFTTSLATSVDLASRATPDLTLVSESGISSPDDISLLRKCGYCGFLIGESLMRAPDPVALLQSLRHV
ncbi:MAG: indole-3-glycerol phosphate synthase TrpC [Verrucomicrobiota bacterium]|nr:indole-3-glycerol phosphate synthase TrpC [Verrucomicrobiota bacterium]